jgi:phytoene desaturase
MVGFLESSAASRCACNAPVTQIRIENGKRHAALSWPSGEFIAADIVVSNADTAWTYKHLVAPQAPSRLDRPQN